MQAVRVPADHVPTPASNPIASSNLDFAGFNGLTHRDQRLAGTGAYANTQFSLEPPDQGLCVSSSYVVETVNTALRTFTSAGAPLTPPVALNQFFGLAPEIIRTTPLVFGDFTSDPKCYYDTSTNRFFLTLLQLDVDSSTGAFTGRSHLEFAVTATGNPTGSWNLFSVDVTDDGNNGTPSHPNCPCFGDQPLIGADSNGFYISTNEYSISPFGAYFNGAQIYAMDKVALAGGSLPVVVAIDAGAIAAPDGGTWYTVQPATTPPGGTYATNTEFFLSALEFFGTLDNRIAVWALTGTNTLSSATPSVVLLHTVIGSEVYGFPLPSAQQKDGPKPLADTFISLVFGGPTNPKEKLEFLASNDDRMQQVVYANGMLWSGLNTVLKTLNGPTRAGIAYFVVSPSVSGGQVYGSMVKQGYVSVNNEYVLFPSIGVNAAGNGVMTFTLVGPDYYPSAAYALIDASNGAGAVHIAAAGAGPDDGFTGYHFFGSPDRVARWGDYSAAVASPDGKIWFAIEYIPGGLRTVLANWGTFIGNVSP